MTQPSTLTLAQLRAVVHELEKNRIRPSVVKSKSHAKRLSARDPTGRYWTPGMTYYTMHNGVFWGKP